MLSDFGLNLETTLPRDTRLLREEARLNDDDNILRWVYDTQLATDSFNEEQTRVYEQLLLEIDSPDKAPVFIDGRPGRGKSYLMKALVAYLRSKGKIVLCCASSGVIAANYENGMTAHHLFKIPCEERRPDDPYSPLQCAVPIGSDLAELFKKAYAIFWDEYAAQHRREVESVSAMLSDITGDPRAFGGIKAVCGGDFRQTPPVVKWGSKGDTIAASVRKSSMWADFRRYELTQSMRMTNDYAAFVDRIGDGTYATIKCKSADHVCLPAEFDFTTSDEVMATRIFPNEILDDPVQASKRAICCTRNNAVNVINASILTRVKGTQHSSYSRDRIAEDVHDSINSMPYLSEMATPNNVPPAKLDMKAGALVQLMRNLDVSAGLSNNRKFILKTVGKTILELQEIDTKKCHWIPRITFTFMVPTSHINIIRTQFPIRLAYASTYHRIIGQTLDLVGLDMRAEFFTHGQLYVGLSRVSEMAKIYILADSEKILFPEQKDMLLGQRPQVITKNIVWQELLRD
jgi:hypothetical protein